MGKTDTIEVPREERKESTDESKEDQENGANKMDDAFGMKASSNDSSRKSTSLPQDPGMEAKIQHGTNSSAIATQKSVFSTNGIGTAKISVAMKRSSKEDISPVKYRKIYSGVAHLPPKERNSSSGDSKPTADDGSKQNPPKESTAVTEDSKNDGAVSQPPSPQHQELLNLPQSPTQPKNVTKNTVNHEGKDSISELWNRYDLTASVCVASHDTDELKAVERQIWKKRKFVPYKGMDSVFSRP